MVERDLQHTEFFYLRTFVVGTNAFGMKWLLLSSPYNIADFFFWIGVEDAGEAVPDPGGGCSQSSDGRGVCWPITYLFFFLKKNIILTGCT